MLVVSNYLPINLHKLYGRNSITTPILAFSRTCARSKRFSMVTGSSSANSGDGAFTTLSERVTFEKEIKKSKFIAVAGSVSDEHSAFAFLSEVRQPRATHNCWAYKVGSQFRSNDDGEPSGTAGKPILSAIEASGIDRVMVVVIRYFGGIKLGTGGLVRAYGGVAAECLRNAPTCVVKSKVVFEFHGCISWKWFLWAWRFLLIFWESYIINFNLFKLRTSSRTMRPEKMMLQWSPLRSISTVHRVWKKL